MMVSGTISGILPNGWYNVSTGDRTIRVKSQESLQLNTHVNVLVTGNGMSVISFRKVASTDDGNRPTIYVG